MTLKSSILRESLDRRQVLPPGFELEYQDWSGPTSATINVVPISLYKSSKN